MNIYSSKTPDQLHYNDNNCTEKSNIILSNNEKKNSNDYTKKEFTNQKIILNNFI